MVVEAVFEFGEVGDADYVVLSTRVVKLTRVRVQCTSEAEFERDANENGNYIDLITFNKK